jgi:hypothetical protein
MALTETTLHHYREERPAQAKWSWAQAVWFITLSCGLFWAGVIALALRFF